MPVASCGMESVLVARKPCKLFKTDSNGSISPDIDDRVNKSCKKQRTLGQWIDDVKRYFIPYCSNLVKHSGKQSWCETEEERSSDNYYSPGCLDRPYVVLI